jgi:hypothetical protein
MKVTTSRRLSGLLFLIANCYLLISNLEDTNLLQLLAAFLFISCSVSLILSANYHRFLFWGGIAVAVAYIITAVSTDDGGNVFASLSILFGIIAGALIFRAGLQRETGKQYQLPNVLSAFDKYPLAMAGFVEVICCLFLFISSYLNTDYRLLVASGIWIIAHIFLIYSDEFLRVKFSKLKGS